MRELVRWLVMGLYVLGLLIGVFIGLNMITAIEPRHLIQPGTWAVSCLPFVIAVSVALVRQARVRQIKLDAVLVAVAAGLLLLTALSHLRQSLYDAFGLLHVVVVAGYLIAIMRATRVVAAEPGA